MSDHSWRHLFVSREKELAWLQGAWGEAKAGRPQFLVLLGESGLGKTRLVQEFYRWLSRKEDPGTPACPEGYWPDAFATEARSLDVNPDSPADRSGPTPPIPWLWWGLRWAIPERRNEIANGCALIDFRANLEPHIRPILAARRLQQVRKDAGWKIVSVVGQAIAQLSPLGWLTAARDAWSLVSEDRRTERDLLRARDTSPAEIAEADRRDLEIQVLETFRLILDPANTQAPTVPVILILDDAQWADPVTLRFADELLRAALTGKWALLVIATHWEAEWKTNIHDAPAPAGQLTQMADLPQRLGLGETWKGAKVIPPIADLSAVVAAALPGVTQAQSDLILAKAGGNPRLLEEILRHLIDHPQFFDGRDTTRPLTKRAEHEVREESFDYHKLVDERFRRLEDHVRQVLGWSSAQGMRFLTSITEAIARRIAPDFDTARLRPALETAEDPHSLVQLFREQGRFNLGEFRQAAFQHVAKENLGFDENELMAVESALREILAAWLHGESAKPGTVILEPADRRDALMIALRVFSPDQPQTRGSWATAMALLAYAHASDYLWRQAHRLAQDLADAAPSGWPLEQLPDFCQFEVISLLLRLRDLGRAHCLASSYAERLVPQCDAPASIDDLRRGFDALMLLGDVELALGDQDSALVTYRRGMEIAESLFAEFGETRKALRDVSVSLVRIGNVELGLGKRESALSAFRRSLGIRERLLAEFGKTPEALRDLSISIEKVGDVELESGNQESALQTYRRALGISAQLFETNSDTPEALRDLSISLGKVGDVELALGHRESALQTYRRALEISVRFVAEYGEAPEALRDLSVSLGRIGDVELALGHRESALRTYRRARDIDERLLAEYGETPEALRDLSVSLGRVGDVELALGHRESALPAYRRARDIDERLLAECNKSPEALRDLAISLERLADAELESGERESARQIYRRALEVAERLLGEFGGTPNALRRVWAFLIKVGDVERALGERESALSAYRRGMESSERMLETFGETSAALRDLMVGHVRLALLSDKSDAIDRLIIARR